MVNGQYSSPFELVWRKFILSLILQPRGALAIGLAFTSMATKRIAVRQQSFVVPNIVD